MDQLLLDKQGEIFAWIYIIFIGVLTLWESLVPRRIPSQSLRFRWANNTVLFAVSLGVTRLVLPMNCVMVAVLAKGQELGLLYGRMVPVWGKILLAIVILDFTRYSVHRLMHYVPILWRFHRVHHTDQDFDISTSLRFHPVEMLIQSMTNISLVLMIGLEPIGVFIFECLSLGANFLSHGNIRISDRIERLLRSILVTPDMHRVHHSTLKKEFNSNYSLIFSFWDRIFQSYVKTPEAGYVNMEIGLHGFEGKEHLRVDHMVLNPFLSPHCRTIKVGSCQRKLKSDPLYPGMEHEK